jgi:hypothetical protein
MSSDAAAFSASTAALLSLYAVGRALVSRWPRGAGSVGVSAEAAAAATKAERKARAWLLSLFISAALSLYGLGSALAALRAIATGGAPALAALLLYDDPAARAVTLAFVSFLILDAAVGLVEYRELLRVDTTWIHHGV